MPIQKMYYIVVDHKGPSLSVTNKFIHSLIHKCTDTQPFILLQIILCLALCRNNWENRNVILYRCFLLLCTSKGLGYFTSPRTRESATLNSDDVMSVCCLRRAGRYTSDRVVWLYEGGWASEVSYENLEKVRERSEIVSYYTRNNRYCYCCCDGM